MSCESVGNVGFDVMLPTESTWFLGIAISGYVQLVQLMWKKNYFSSFLNSLIVFLEENFIS